MDVRVFHTKKESLARSAWIHRLRVGYFEYPSKRTLPSAHHHLLLPQPDYPSECRHSPSSARQDSTSSQPTRRSLTLPLCRRDPASSSRSLVDRLRRPRSSTHHPILLGHHKHEQQPIHERRPSLSAEKPSQQGARRVVVQGLAAAGGPVASEGRPRSRARDDVAVEVRAGQAGGQTRSEDGRARAQRAAGVREGTGCRHWEDSTRRVRQLRPPVQDKELTEKLTPFVNMTVQSNVSWRLVSAFPSLPPLALKSEDSRSASRHSFRPSAAAALRWAQ